MWERLKRWARALRDDTLALYFCARDPRTPLAAKLFALAIAAYALSPIDLIPDFVPVLGYLDEVILLPGLIYLCLRMIPAPVLAQAREKSRQWFAEKQQRPRSYVAAAVIVLLWVALLWWLGATLLW